MSTTLFSDIVFGPIQSRRLGVSLGINLLPIKGKLCNFDCIYCECGFNTNDYSFNSFPTKEDVIFALSEKMVSMRANNEKIDSLTFAGNGEPTLHPDFEAIVNEVSILRNIYFPDTKISVLSNASMIQNEHIARALQKVDNAILKLDSALNDKMQLINRPNSFLFNIDYLKEQLRKLNKCVIIQTLFLRGKVNDIFIDNTTDLDIFSLNNLLKYINPKQLMIYSIDRETPVKGLEKIPFDELNLIAKKFSNQGFEVSTV